ncbi:MAG: UDP-N-acetylglucosamine--N-acetylmuramyl-(pentapeptide) pyrophosphoryl-undecaprenol N-acetylglucosamine transferase [Ilumatobacteraceae bacterium]|nr:UDP-N-acetylglucosamine--N-acetylmuramyl-(pentapeptide) pyrophosphoryl-undecaprenol N-acetylglucosamine transferase [Ilumatobacteraceae bacterium]
MSHPAVFAVVTGGGTSGHVVPAIAILELLEDLGHSSKSLRYVGSRRGVEKTLMQELQFECEYLPISGLQRGLSIKSFLRNALLPQAILRSYVHAYLLIRRWKPDVVISVGGYASSPMAFAARLRGVSLVCVSYDRTPGLATRRQAKHATSVAVAFEGSRLPGATITGAPVRHELRELDVAARRASARHALGIPQDRLMLSVVGGSLGSAVLNDNIERILEAMGQMQADSTALYHICGHRHLGVSVLQAPVGVLYTRVAYETRMTDLLAATDVMVCRAGASTIAEIATVGVAAIVVPWKDAAENHQHRNASWLQERGGALVVNESDIAKGALTDAIISLLKNGTERNNLATAARSCGELHRGRTLGDLIEAASHH